MIHGEEKKEKKAAITEHRDQCGLWKHERECCKKERERKGENDCVCKRERESRENERERQEVRERES